jgi:hypothetical protein
MGVISAAFTGLLTFLSGTVLPALLAFFSGPVGWTVLAVAAVVAMAIAFREPLGKFITWLGSVFKKGWDGFVNNILKKPIQNYFKWWRSNWEKAAGFVTGVFGKVKGAVVTVFGAVTGVVRTIIAGAFRFGAELFNNWIAALNNILKGLKQIPFLGLRLLPLLTPIKVPAFAKGGYVDKPTIGLIGEAGPEYVIPAAQMEAINKMYAQRLKDMLTDNERQFQERIAFAAAGGAMATPAGAAAVTADAKARLDAANRDAQMRTEMAKAQRIGDLTREGNLSLKLSAAQSSNTLTTWQPMQADMKEEQAKVNEWMKVQRDTMSNLLDTGFNTLINATASAVEASRVNVDIRQDAQAVVNIVTGPVLRFNDEDYVRIDDLRSAMQATAKSVFDSLRNPSTRIALGLA